MSTYGLIEILLSLGIFILMVYVSGLSGASTEHIKEAWKKNAERKKKRQEKRLKLKNRNG